MRVVVAFLINTLCNFAIGLLVAKFLGPAEFGRFALALAVGMTLQIAFFDWIRLSAVRFYSERSRAGSPELRATLDVAFAILAAAVAAAAVIAMLSGLALPLSNGLIGLAVAASITNGLFDYNTALVRARFHDGLYSRLIVTKNLLALVVTAGGALAFGSATVALAGVCISMAGTVLVARDALSDRHATPRFASRARAREYAHYAAPIVAANLLYILIPLANRTLIARWYGFAETGQFSLAFDMGVRIVAAIGSALDVLLFQMAVRADELHGAAHGREQVARNMAVVFAIMLPTCAGVWLVLPSMEKLVVPMEYRGPFEHYFGLLMPGLFAFGMLNFAVNPVFQIAKRTRPMILAAVVACIVEPPLVFALPANAYSLAIAQSGAMLAALATLIVFAALSGARFPPPRDLLIATLAAAAMVGAVLPLRALEPGVVTLLLEIVAGLVIYSAFILAFDVAGLRGVAINLSRSLRARVARAL